MTDGADHTAVLLAFAKRMKAPRPPHEALMAALRDGLCTYKVSCRMSATGSTETATWRLTPLGMEKLRAIIAALPPAEQPTPAKRHRQRPVKRRPSRPLSSWPVA